MLSLVNYINTSLIVQTLLLQVDTLVKRPKPTQKAYTRKILNNLMCLAVHLA